MSTKTPCDTIIFKLKHGTDSMIEWKNTDQMAKELSKVKLLALDLDGTILTDEKHVTPRMASALKAAVNAGLVTVYVTGRPLTGIPDELMAIPEIRYAITSNGAVTTDLMTGKRLRGAYLDNQAAKEIAKIPMERNLIHSVFVDGIGYCEQVFFKDQWALYMGTKHEPYIRKSRRGTDSINELIDRSDVGTENIWFMCHSQQERDELNQLIHSRWEVQTVLTAITDVEVGSRQADKGLALDDLAQRLCIAKEEILAIGDNENDLGMLRSSGITVAMGNATDSVMEMAMILTDTNEEDGAAKIIEKILEYRK